MATLRKIFQWELVGQFQFPYHYDTNLDRLPMGFYSDHVDAQRAHAYTQKYVGMDYKSGSILLESWIQSKNNHQVLALLSELMNIRDSATEPLGTYTGYHVQKADKYSPWYIQLFAKHPESTAAVYTGCEAPNVHKASCVNDNWCECP